MRRTRQVLVGSMIVSLFVAVALLAPLSVAEDDVKLDGKAIFARPRPGHNNRDDYIASSVMLLDCAKLTHWDVEVQFGKMFAGELDYEDWIILATEARESIGFLENHWNDFDRLTPYIERVMERMPMWSEAGIKRVVCGAIPHTPDANPLLGPAEGLQNFWQCNGA